MHLAYAYSPHHHNPAKAGTGGTVHIKQFIANMIDLDHQVYMWSANHYPDANLLPHSRFKRVFALRKMDAIIMRIDFSAPFTRHFGLFPWRQILNNPVIVWEFNGIPEFGHIIGLPETDIQKFIQELVYYGRGCDLAISVSDKMTQYIAETLKMRNVITVPNGSDPQLFSPHVKSVAAKNDYLNIVWMGSGSLRWNSFEMLRHTAELLMQYKTDIKPHIHVLGQNSEELMVDMSPNVTHHGLIPYEDVPHWLSNMDIGLCLYDPGPADYGSPLKLFDYLASGLTVVSTPQPQVQQIFAELDQSDLIIPHDDSAALADVLLKLAQNPDRLHQQGQKGRDLIVNKYNWRNSVQRIMQAIQALL